MHPGKFPVLFFGLFLMGFSSHDEFERVDRESQQVWNQRLPDLSDLRELLFKEGDLVCPHEYTGSGEEMILSSSEIRIVGNDKDAPYYAYGFEEHESLEGVRMFEKYAHANVNLVTDEMSPDAFGVNVNASGLLVSLRCVYYDSKSRKTVKIIKWHKPISRCFQLWKEIGEGEEFDGSSEFIWCR